MNRNRMGPNGSAAPNPGSKPMSILKHSISSILALVCVGSLATAQTESRRTIVTETPDRGTVTESTSTTTTGFINSVGPDEVAVRVEGTAAPIIYSSSARTVYVDDAGQPVSREIITSGVPVTVQYSRLGDRLVADRVVVRRHHAEPRVIERDTTVARPPVVEERVPVEKKVYVAPAPAPLVEKKTTTTTTTTRDKKEKKDD